MPSGSGRTGTSAGTRPAEPGVRAVGPGHDPGAGDRPLRLADAWRALDADRELLVVRGEDRDRADVTGVRDFGCAVADGEPRRGIARAQGRGDRRVVTPAIGRDRDNRR